MGIIKKKSFNIKALEKRLMLDASLGGLASTVVFSEDTAQAGPNILDTDGVTVTGSTTNFDGVALNISTNGGADDQLTIRNEGTGAGQIGFNGTNVTYGGTLVGTLSSNGANGSNLTIDLNASANKAAIERLIENITYQNNSDNPVQDRTVNFSLDNGSLFSQNMVVKVVAQNDTPSIDTNTGTNVNEGSTTTITSAMLGISDPDNTNTQVGINISTNVTNGRLELSTNAGVAISSFTLDDLNTGKVRYVHNGSETLSDSFGFTVTDGSITLPNATFNISVNAVNDAPIITTNAGADVFEGFSTDIGATEVPTKFGTTVLTQSALGDFNNFQGVIDNQNSQFRIIVTTPAATPTSVPGQAIFESGGSGKGVGLYLNSSNQLDFYAGSARTTPHLTSIALNASTQYAIVVEIDQTNGELRLHFSQAGDFTWYEYGRAAEETKTGFNETDMDGGNAAGLGKINSSSGGFNGSVSGNTTFQGSIDSAFIISRFPSGGTILQNTALITTDADTSAANIIYTITTDAVFGSITKNGVDIGVGATFTQADLNSGIIDYTHGGGATGGDSFQFSVSDGNTTITNQTYNINVISGNSAPVITNDPLTVAEDANNNETVGYVVANDPDTVGGQVLTWSIQGGTGAGIFAIDSATGLVTVANNSTLDYETTTSYTLVVRVTDDAGAPLFDEETITINVQDIYEGTAPTFTGWGPFNVNENSANNTVVGTVTTTDAEGDGVTYSITGGNVNNAFKIDNNGVIRVNGTNQLDFELRGSYTLTIRATDNSILNLASQRNVTININDLAEGPSLQIASVIETIDPTVTYNATNQNFYKHINSNVSFNTALNNSANATLNGANGHLLTITSGSENTFVDNLISNHIWLAATDSDVEGEWKWVAGPETGSVFSLGGTAQPGFYTRWNGSEPNSGTSANNAYMNTNGTWYDQNGGSRGYVIEWESYDVINNREYSLNYSGANGSDITNGTSLGYVIGADDDGDTITYSITAGNGDGIFEIDANTGELRILDNTNINTSVTNDFTLTIRVDDGTGAFDTKDININFNQLFSITQNNTLTAPESGTTAITSADLQVSDSDSTPSELVFTVTTQPAHGQLELTTAPGAAINSFTQDDVDNNRLVFVSNGDENTSDSFTFSVTDGATTVTSQTFDITVTPTNDAPIINVNTGTTIAEGGSKTITAAMLNSLDADDADTGLTFTASNFINGHIEVSGVTQNTFTQDDINNNRVVFIHDGAETNGRFNVSLADGGEDGAGTASATFTLTKTDVNDAPVITTNTGTNVLEGGTTVITSAILNTTDPDDTPTGLRYTLSNIRNGVVELTTNPGVPVITFTQNDINNNRVIFRHDGNEGDARFTVTVADGGENGAGTDTAIVNLTKNPVNDAPTIFKNLGTSVNQNSIVILKNAVLAAADTDDNAAGITFTASNLINGQLEFLSNPNVAITSFTQEDINNSLVVFRHSGPVGPASFNFVIADGGEDGAGTASGTFNLTVDNTNDSPTITTNAAPTMDEGATLTITTAMLDSFDPDDFGTGLTWTVTNLVNGTIQVGGVTQNTFTQADLDNDLVTFTHDNSETTTAGFDVQIADGGEDGATIDTATFTINVTPVNEGPTLSINDGNPTLINLNDYTFNSYNASPGQDLGGTLTISADGSTVTFTDANMWKQIATPYTISTNTVLSFEFFADRAWEIQGIGFENGNADFNFLGYELFGTQNWNLNDSYRGYQVGDGWVRYDITIGQTFTSPTDLTHLIFTVDNDANLTGNTAFRNINFYESDQVYSVDEGDSFTITNTHINSADVDDGPADLTFTASNITNGHIEVSGVTQNTFTQDDINNNRVVFVHDGTNTLTAGFDVSLADGGEDGTSADTGRFTLIVNPVDDAPLAATNNGMSTATEGGTTTLTTAMLNTSDNDTEPRKVVFDITGALTNGRLERSTNPGVSISSFTLADLQNGTVRYVHNGGETISDSFDFTVRDETTTLASDTFNITVASVNDAVVLNTNTGANITESSTVTITNSLLSTSDNDDAASGITYTITDTANGWVELTTKTGFPVTSFTQDDINNNRVVFRHDGSGSSAASFDFSVQDGGEDSAAAISASFSLNVNTPLNESPVIAITNGAPTTIDFSGTTINPYDPSGVGDGQSGTPTNFIVSDDGSVLTLYGNAWKRISLPMTITADTVITFDFRSTKEGEIHGIGFDTDSNYSNGHFAYELFGTDTNAGFNQTYNTYSLGDGWTRFEIPVGADYTGAITELFFVADDDQGANSDAISQFRNISIYEANPTVTVTEGGNVTITNTYLNAFDTDDTASGLTYTASNITNGHIEVSGVTQNTFTQDDVNNNRVVFVHDDSETTTASFDLSLADGGENASVADTATFNLTVTPVNESPTITGDLTLSMNEGGNVTLTTTDLGFSDVDDIATGVTYTISNITNGHIEVSGVTQNTFTADDIINARVVFIHDGSETTSAGFDISLADGGENGSTADTASMSISVTPVNDDPSDIAITGTSIHESSAIGTVIGTLSTTDADLPGDSFTYSITNDPDNKFIIVGNELRLNNLLDYELNTQHSVTIQTNDGNGGLYSEIFTINILDNTAPTDIIMDNDTVTENSAIGTTVALLNAVDADSGEVMTYTLMGNPDNLFAIDGNKLVVDSAIDFEAIRSSDIIIRVQDVDGNIFDKTFTINIQDVSEFTGDLVTLDSDSFGVDNGRGTNSGTNGDFFGNNRREIFRVGDIMDPFQSFGRPGFIGAALAGNADSAFYGENMQIIRQNTTLVMQGLLQDGQGSIFVPAAFIQQSGDEIPSIDGFFSHAQSNNDQPEQSDFVSPQEALRQTLLKLQQMENDNNGNPFNNDDFSALDQDFDNILRYHLEKQAALREALLKS